MVFDASNLPVVGAGLLQSIALGSTIVTVVAILVYGGLARVALRRVERPTSVRLSWRRLSVRNRDDRYPPDDPDQRDDPDST